MRTCFALLLLLLGFRAAAQPPKDVTALDFVRVKNNHMKEALFYYEHNWKAYRDLALQRGIIKGYKLLSVAADSAADFHLVLMTVYADSAHYAQSEAAFAPILRELRPNGPLLLNAVQPADFRQNLFFKTATTVFGAEARPKE